MRAWDSNWLSRSVHLFPAITQRYRDELVDAFETSSPQRWTPWIFADVCAITKAAHLAPVLLVSLSYVWLQQRSSDRGVGGLKCCQCMEMNVFCLCTWPDLSCFSPSYIIARASGLSLYRAGVLYLEPDLYANTHTYTHHWGRRNEYSFSPAAIASNIIIFPHLSVPLRIAFRKNGRREISWKQTVILKPRVKGGTEIDGLNTLNSTQSNKILRKSLTYFPLLLSSIPSWFSWFSVPGCHFNLLPSLWLSTVWEICCRRELTPRRFCE